MAPATCARPSNPSRSTALFSHQRHVHLAGTRNSCALTRAATVPAACPICCTLGGNAAGLQRRRHARRRQDAHLVRHRVGLRLCRRHPGPAANRWPGWPTAEPAWLCPSHGPVVLQPRTQLRNFGDKLAALEKLYLRGYGVEGGSVAYQDKVSTPDRRLRMSGRSRRTCSNSSARTSGPISA